LRYYVIYVTLIIWLMFVRCVLMNVYEIFMFKGVKDMMNDLS
jgi:hypothetical protein